MIQLNKEKSILINRKQHLNDDIRDLRIKNEAKNIEDI